MNKVNLKDKFHFLNSKTSAITGSARSLNRKELQTLAATAEEPSEGT